MGTAPVSSRPLPYLAIGRQVLAAAAVGSSIFLSLLSTRTHDPMSVLWRGNAVQPAILLLTPGRSPPTTRGQSAPWSP